jgi:hypothetical protein
MSRARDFADLAGSADAGGLTGRNLIINGAMQVAQRGTTSGSKTATGFHTLDRWEGQASGATYELDQLTMSDSDRETYGFEKYLHFDVTTGNNNCAVAQKIEAKNLFHTLGSNQKFTLSFLAKGTNPNGGTVDARFFWTDGTNYGTQTNEDVTLTSSWQQFSITIDAPAVDNSVDVDNASAYLSVSFAQPSGDTSTNAWNIDVTGVQLEVGEQATPFEHEPFTSQWHKCQRYCTVYNIGGGDVHPENFILQHHAPPGKPGHVDVNNRGEWMLEWPFKRAAPTLTFTDGDNMRFGVGNNGLVNASGNPAMSVGTSPEGGTVFQSVSSGITLGASDVSGIICNWMKQATGNNPKIVIDAEL